MERSELTHKLFDDVTKNGEGIIIAFFTNDGAEVNFDITKDEAESLIVFLMENHNINVLDLLMRTTGN